MNETDKAWTAGIIDGEGCIHIKKIMESGHLRFHLLIRVAMTEIEAIKVLENIWGGCLYKGTKDKRKNTREIWVWVINGINASNLLRQCSIYLRAKKEQAKLAIGFQERVSGKIGVTNSGGRRTPHIADEERKIRERMYEKMKELKK